MDATDELRKCPRCKKDKELNEFNKKPNGDYTKWCSICLDLRSKNREKNKCIHGKEKTICKTCGGNSLCQHGRQKYNCKPCGGSSICQHNRRKRECKECSNPIKITIKHWLNDSKQADKKYNRYTGEDYLDDDYCQELINFYKHCYHCSVLLQYVHYQDDLSSIERLDNKLEHSKKNCVLACMKCNKKKLTNKNI